jgi:hypothetical protein
MKIYRRDEPIKQISKLIKAPTVKKPKLIAVPKMPKLPVPKMPPVGKPIGLHPHYRR